MTTTQRNADRAAAQHCPQGIHGTIDCAGRVTITFESQAELLWSYDGRKYLPCFGNCGTVLIVEENVVLSTCFACSRKHDGSDDRTECRSCFGHGHIDNDGYASSDRRDRKCLDCRGLGYIAADGGE